MKELEYPFDSDYIIKKKKSLKKQLLETSSDFIEKNIAILGGSTTDDVKLILKLFLLNNGIKPNFYESQYNKYWEEGMFENKKLEEFKPDIIFIHTTNRNITNYPNIGCSLEETEIVLNLEYDKYYNMWISLMKKYNCIIIQNNFEYPFYRILGNKDATSNYGKVNFITRLNLKFAEFAEMHENFLINDINYQSSLYGLERWSDQFYWHLYKYALAVPAIPTLAFNVANIIKGIYGKNKKGLVLDLDNTLWGGIVGDDGVENIIIGKETSEGQVYREFQEYINELKKIGVILNINSKNDIENAIAGLNHPDGILRPDDFIAIKANWNMKSRNIIEIAEELNLGLDSLVFVDDNPAERAMVNQCVPKVSTPIMERAEKYIETIDRSGYFEVINLSKDDIKKNKMYKENIKRNTALVTFENYEDYLKSLKMRAKIEHFIPLYMTRIAQLTNKTNQFNLTTKRYTQAEIEAIAKNNEYITLYGKLEDIFGDNGVISVVIGHIREKILEIDLWIMSCRVLKRNMEYAMMDVLVEKAKANGLEKIKGFYYPTIKNTMVKDFYDKQGFIKISEDEQGNIVWELDITKEYECKNKFIKIEE